MRRQSQRPLCGVLAVCARSADVAFIRPDPLFTLTGVQKPHGHPSNLSEPLRVRSLSDPSHMLFAAQSMMFQAAAGLVAAPLAARSVERAAAPSMAVGLVYSTTTGNTETVAGYIAGETGLSAVDIADLTGEGVAAFDGALRLSDYPASHLPAWPGPACSAVDAAELPASMLCRPHRWRAHLAHRRGLRALGHRVGRVRATPCCLSFPAPLVGRSLIRTRSRAGSSTAT